jgi:hypothetical protein
MLLECLQFGSAWFHSVPAQASLRICSRGRMLTLQRKVRRNRLVSDGLLQLIVVLDVDIIS